MKQLKPKAWHELFLANADKAKIVGYLEEGQDRDVTRLAVTLARQCTLFADFARLWKMRVSDLDAKLSSEHYMQEIYTNRRTLYKDLKQEDSR